MTKRLDDNQEFINTILNEANWSQANVQVKLEEKSDEDIAREAGLTYGGKRRGRPSTKPTSGNKPASIAIEKALDPITPEGEARAKRVLDLSKANVPAAAANPTGGIEPKSPTGEDIDPEAPKLGSENKLKNIQAAFHSRKAQGVTGGGPDGRSIEPVVGPNADPNLGHDPKLHAAGVRARLAKQRKGEILGQLKSPGVATGERVGTLAVRRKRPDGTYESPYTAGMAARNITQVKDTLTPPQRDPQRELASTDYSLKYDACPLCESQLEDDEVIFENIGDHFNSLLNVLNKVEAINEGEEVDFDDLLTESHEEGKCPLCESFVEDDQVIMTNMNEHFDVILEMLEEAEEEEGTNIEDIPQGSGQYKEDEESPKPGSIAARGNPTARARKKAGKYN